MSKYFRPWNIDQTLLLPPNVQDFVPKGHVSRFIVELVRESLDLKEIMGSYVSGLGQPPFDPRMMVALLLHGYPATAGSPLPLGCAPIDAVNQHRQLCRGQHQRPTRFDVRRPQEHAVLEPFGEKAKAAAIPVHDLDEVGLPAPEHEEMAREGILPQHTLNQHGEPIDALAVMWSST
jgi:hypothetical protein